MKKIISILLITLLAATLAACGNGVKITYFKDDYVPKYNDVFYDSAVDWISEDFQNENVVRVWGFIDEDPETRLPDTRTFIVTDREQFENIFVDNFTGFEVDFASEMVIVYTFGIEYVLPAFILDMNLNGDTLTVDYTIPTKIDSGSAVRPFQRWFAIKLDKLEVTSAVFNYISTHYKK